MKKLSLQQIRTFKKTLEEIYRKYNRREYIGSDPLMFAYRYSTFQDQEIAAFISAVLSYGRVQSIQNALQAIFEKMGSSPYDYLLQFDSAKEKHWTSFRYRFTSGYNLTDLFGVLRETLRKYETLEAFFLRSYQSTHTSVLPALQQFCESMIGDFQKRFETEPSRGLRYLLAGPGSGGTSKRLLLFLRWMIRKDQVDLGLWNSVSTDKLIMPVDVHIAKLTRNIGFHDRSAVDQKTVLSITDQFRRIHPSDPVKYDFSLSRVGILGICSGGNKQMCIHCALAGICIFKKINRNNRQGASKASAR